MSFRADFSTCQEISLVCPNSSKIRVSAEIKTKN